MQFQSMTADKNLLYLIQSITGLESAEILSYFYETASELRANLAKSKASRPVARLKSFYPGTAIPFTMEASANKWRQDNVTMYVRIGFPRNGAAYKDLAHVAAGLAEAQILGTPAPFIPKFEQPTFKAPMGKRHLLNKPVTK